MSSKNCIICNCDRHESPKDKYDIDINNYCKYLGFCSKCYKKVKPVEKKKIEWTKIINNYFDLRDFEKVGV